MRSPAPNPDYRWPITIVRLVVLVVVTACVAHILAMTAVELWDENNQPLSWTFARLFDFCMWFGGHLPEQKVPGVVYLLIMSLVAAVAWVAWSTKTDGVPSNV